MLNFTKVISTSVDSISRRLIKVLRKGLSDIQTPMQAAPYGVDSNPVKDMIAVYGPTQQKGQNVIIGYLNKSSLAAIGENRNFSTDENGNVVFYTWLKNDGTMEIGGDTDFMVRYSELKSAFDELKSDLNSFISVFNTHIHPAVGVDTVTGAPVTVTLTPSASPGTPSAADISGAKIAEIKTFIM